MRVLEGTAGRRPTALEEAYQVFRPTRVLANHRRDGGPWRLATARIECCFQHRHDGPSGDVVAVFRQEVLPSGLPAERVGAFPVEDRHSAES